MAKIETSLGDAVLAINIDFEKAWTTKRWQDTTHFHVDSEIHIMLSGNALVEIGGKDVEISEGDVCLLAPRSSHYPKKSSEALEKANFSFALTQNHAAAKGKRLFSEYLYYSNIFKSVNDYFIINDTELLSIIKKLIGESYSPENEHIFGALLSVFFITLAKRIKEKNLPYREEALGGVPENENLLRQVKTVEEFFQQRYSEEINIGDLAKKLCLSVPQTHRIVKRIFDEGFKKTRMKQRIEHACMLIKRNDLPLTEIAYLCGYTSYNGFLSAFKSYMGKTPKEYEKSLR